MKLFAGLIAALAVAMFVTTPADARKKDKANSGYCKSGAHVGDMGKCKEMAARSKLPAESQINLEGRHEGGLSARYVYVH